MEIWINPECSKCRVAIDTLDQSGATYTVRRYLEDPPSAAEIEAVLNRLGLKPWDIVRLHEPIAQELGLDQLDRSDASRDAWITALVEHPILIQRPIITTDDGTAHVARDEAALRTALESS